MKATHSLAVYPNYDVMFDSAVQFLKAGLENNEVAILLSNNFTGKKLLVLRYLYHKKYVDSIQKTGPVILCDVNGTYFLWTQKNICSQKVLYSWAEMIHEAERHGKGLRAFVDLEYILHDNIMERLFSCKSEINSALLDHDRFLPDLKIMNGCLGSDITRIAPESFRLIQQYHNGVYVVP